MSLSQNEFNAIVGAMFQCGAVAQEKLAKLLRAELGAFIPKRPKAVKSGRYSPHFPRFGMILNDNCYYACQKLETWLCTPNHSDPVWRGIVDRTNMKIPMIKKLREFGGYVVKDGYNSYTIGLKDAKDAVELCFHDFLTKP